MKEKFTNISADGFSVIEVLLALAITAIIGITISTVFWSGIRVDEKLRYVHDNAMEVLMADQALTYDLENAVNLDLSLNYPNRKVFEGHKEHLAFLVATTTGIKRVRYFSGLVDWGKVTKTMIGKKTSRISGMTSTHADNVPIEFLFRQESGLADWANQSKVKPSTQIIAAGLKKDTFNCSYAPFDKNLDEKIPKDLVYSDHWDKRELPMAVSCQFSVYDAQHPKADIIFRRDIFLAPIWVDHEQHK